MTLNNLFTKSGARIHIHFGAQMTTNLWGPWVVVTDLALKQELNACFTEAEFQKVQLAHENDFTALTTPYVRPRKTNTIGAPAPAPMQTNTLQDMPVQSQPDAQPQPVDIIPDKIKRDARIEAVKGFLQFFSEFKFNPAARFINTFARQASNKAARNYLVCYVKLINNSDWTDIAEKTKSPEFDVVASALLTYPPEKKINSRLDIYFGDAGTGKTTEAIAEYPEADVVPCNSSMLPDELMRVFDFNDENGNPVFKPSSLRLAMEAGKPIIFDEINLLSFECLRLLQTLTDNKSVIHYNNEAITIKDGFKVIGTMNLTVNDQVYNLPEPLVDRAETLKEFKLSAKDLAAYAF